MIVRGHRVYRGHRGGHSHLSAVLLTVFFLVLLALLTAFSMLPEYLVYHRDSVEMVVPMLEENGQPYTVESVAPPQPYAGAVLSSVQVTEPDYRDVDMANIRGINYLRCYYVAGSKMTETGLDNAVKDAQRNNLQGLILQMKDEKGTLNWVSEVAMASSNAANSQWDPSAYIAELKADGWFLAADVSCGVDTLLAEKNPQTALRDATGAVYEDGSGKWVDPWNRTVRTYIVELCQDLLRMGFDEIILSHVEHPNATVSYTRDVAADLSRTACVMNFSMAVRQALDASLTASGAHLDVRMSRDALFGGDNGQSLENFLKVFDRVVISTAYYGDDVKYFIDSGVDSTLRFVPQMTWAFGGASVALDPAAPVAEK
ncbi:MAG: hypothetical protein IKQ69_09680 [Oscillospiraceae bacterium]|nr:hypothetical protein [Oscillospiraceae bacterium]